MRNRTRKRKRSAISLFAGAGGLDLGVHQAGFRVLASIENDKHCCATLRCTARRLRWKTNIIEDDIRLFDPLSLRSDLALKAGELDLLFGGPPCQAFSQIGKQQGLADERGLLIFQVVRFAEALEPKAILIEQVKGILSSTGPKGEKGEVFRLFLEDLDRLGYVPKWKIVNAADYGVPQLRYRVFIVATKKPNGFEFPPPTHAPKNDSYSLFPLPPYKTVGKALKGLKRPSKKNGKKRHDSHIDVTPNGDRKRIHGVPEGMYLASQWHLSPEQRGRLTKKDTTKYLRLSRRELSKTLRCGEIFFHPTQDRYLTPREYLRIHGYPDNYLLEGPIRSRSGRVRDLDQHRQVANSVPPPVAEAIAKSILTMLENSGH